ncbi:Mpv17 / PMP22 [Balamuthia mandrillaris]
MAGPKTPEGQQSRSSSTAVVSYQQQLWQLYQQALNRRPVLTKALTSALINSTGNLFAQKLVERQPLDLKRLLRFTVLGFVLSPFSHYWFWLVEQINWQPFGKWKTLAKVAVDQLVFGPIINVLFYTFLGVLEGKGPRANVSNTRQNLWPTLRTSWKVWPFASLVNFYFVPPHLRVLFSNMVGFFWVICLTILSKRNQK